MIAEAQRWLIGGRVQGVGYRPFVYHLAHSLNLSGWVRNNSGTVEVHAQGSALRLKVFGKALLECPPPTAVARLIEVRDADLESGAGFLILPSTRGAQESISVPLDLSPCDECLTELKEPSARRHGYPFINCTQCGPRYTIIGKLPYDRCNTTLAGFDLCLECGSEYADPFDRRFHAQPLACAACGPALYWRDAAGEQAGNLAALAAAGAALRAGKILAMRGIGGYHLLCDAANEATVCLLRARKGRVAKPFAVMVPSRGSDSLETIRAMAYLTDAEAAAVTHASRPIVLLRKRNNGCVAPSVAPGLGEVGVMLPYSPLHHLLLEETGFALLATSGNVTGEPILTSPEEAESRLSHVADGFLQHNRPIARPAEDGVARLVAGCMRPLRLGRGSAPLEIALTKPMDIPTLAVGAHQKLTIALAWKERAIVSPHIGDLATPRGRAVFAQVAHDLQMLYGVTAERIVHDAHPNFASTRWARESGLPTEAVWHHHAHASALAGEYPTESPRLCFAWDGLGLGPDGSLWGGEALLGLPGHWQRVASFRPFRLLGGERVTRAPWRSAVALCWESGVTWPEGERRAGEPLRRAFDQGVNSPWTTSVGRLFDAAAALTGVSLVTSYEAEGPMRLESLCETPGDPVDLPLERDSTGIWRTDWGPLLGRLLDDSMSQAARAGEFHASLAQALCAQAIVVRRETGVNQVGFTGGAFQNRVLTERVQRLLHAACFEVFIPRTLPMNDAAISFGQIIEVAAHLAQ